MTKQLYGKDGIGLVSGSKSGEFSAIIGCFQPIYRYNLILSIESGTQCRTDSMLNRLDANLTIGYPMPNRLDANLTIGYPMLNRLDANLTIGYPIPNRLDANITLGYPMLNRLDANLTFGYPMLNQLDANLTIIIGIS